MEESRTKNTIRNVRSGAIVQFVNKLMAFVVRTIFIKALNSEYLGINGLFTNILTILSFAELGIGTAIIYNMYKPVADHNHEKIKSLMQLYKKAYNIIGIIVFVAGLCVIPFMNIIIKDAPNIKENIILIYVLFLFDTASSYFFTYKKSIISAHQKQSIIDNIDSIFYLLRSILEIIFLIITKNFIVYLIIQILTTIVENIFLAKKANRMYPYLKEKNVTELSKDEKNNIFNNVKSLVVYKFGSVIMNGTDNILMSALVNVSTVGLCSNYILIINSVKAIITSAINGVTASVGNLNAVGDSKQKEKVFYLITFVNYIVYSFCAIAFIVLLDPFIELWLGTGYLLGLSVSIALSISFWIDGLRNPGYTYRTTLGLFQKGKSTPYIGAITNIVLSVLFCKLWGVVGIFIATSVAQLVSYSWIDPYLIHKYEFKMPVSKYYRKLCIYAGVFIASMIVSLTCVKSVNVEGIMGLVLKVIVVCTIPNIVNIVVFRNSEEYLELKKKIIEPILKRTRIL